MVPVQKFGCSIRLSVSHSPRARSITTSWHSQVVFPDAQELLSALSSMKVENSKADLTFSTGGVTVVSVNASSTFQTSVFLSRKLFERYTVSDQVTQVSLELSTLVFTLKMFISADAGVGIVMQYPGPDQELIVKSNNFNSSNNVVDLSLNNTQYQNERYLPTLFARIETLVFSGSANLLENMGDSMTSTIFSDRELFREAVEDLERVGSKVARLELRDRPPQMTLSSASPDIEVFVDIPVHQLTGFTCSLPSVEHRYNLKHLLAALSASPNKRGETHHAEQHHIGIYVDAQGMMKVTHMWTSSRERQVARDDENGSVDETSDLGTEKMVATMFFLMSLADEDDGDEARAAVRGMDAEVSIQSSRM